jgi:hypothetical protein
MRGTTVRLLVDGVELVSTTDSAIATAGRAGVTLGGAAGGGSGLLGGILGVLGGILGGANPDDATLQLDNFRVAPALSDSTGASSGAYLRGPTLQRPGALVGDTDTAAAFDGANDFAAIPDAAALDLADGPFTLEAWLKRSSSSTARQTLLQKGTGAYHWALENNRLALLKEGTGTIVQSTTTLTDTTAFHHVAVTRSATGATKLYIDGADVTGPVTAHALTDTATALFIGGQPAGVTPLGGTLDEVAVYRSELTPAQILDHRRAGSGTG